MIKKENLKELGTATIVEKICWSLLYTAIFVLGKHIPLPFAKSTSGTDMLLLSTGGDISNVSILSLGIGPWMTSMIIVGMLVQLKLPLLDHIPEKVMDRFQKGLTLLLALMQSSALLREINLTKNTPEVHLICTLFLTAGCMLMIWLSVENDVYGIGGITFVLMSNMIYAIFGIFNKGLVAGLSPFWKIIVDIIGVIVMLVLCVICVIMSKAERRIPVVKQAISSEYSSRSYLPIRLLPAGTMPAMFAATMFVMPRYALIFFGDTFHWNILNRIAEYISYDNIFGVIYYCLVLVALTYSFSYISVDPLTLSENMAKSGDYIPGCHPGRETDLYIRRVVNYFSFVCSIFFIALIGLPSGLNAISPRLANLSLLPTYVIIISGFISGILEELDTLEIRGHYKNLL